LVVGADTAGRGRWGNVCAGGIEWIWIIAAGTFMRLFLLNYSGVRVTAKMEQDDRTSLTKPVPPF
jgi:hypothetical protein